MKKTGLASVVRLMSLDPKKRPQSPKPFSTPRGEKVLRQVKPQTSEGASKIHRTRLQKKTPLGGMNLIDPGAMSMQSLPQRDKVETGGDKPPSAAVFKTESRRPLQLGYTSKPGLQLIPGK